MRARATAAVLALAVMSGCAKRYIAFTTATKFALDVSQKADQTIDVSLGYDRAELASIPATEDNAGADVDTYSILGKFMVRYGNPFSGTPLVLNQVFATGAAARNAAESEAGRAYFGALAHDVEEQKRAQKGEQP